jgi:hypothetical protein
MNFGAKVIIFLRLHKDCGVNCVKKELEEGGVRGRGGRG